MIVFYLVTTKINIQNDQGQYIQEKSHRLEFVRHKVLFMLVLEIMDIVTKTSSAQRTYIFEIQPFWHDDVDTSNIYMMIEPYIVIGNEYNHMNMSTIYKELEKIIKDKDSIDYRSTNSVYYKRNGNIVDYNNHKILKELFEEKRNISTNV